MNYKISLFTISQMRKLSSTSSFSQQKNHYESLGLAKNATQADVKGAYYKLSKVYHPDRNQGQTLDQREQHSQKFRDITEAYEVLGNVRTRRMYDKGFLGVSHHHHPREPTPEDPLHKFYKSRETRTRPPPSDGRQPIYDFDEWSRRHYGESVRRAQQVKEKRAFHAEQQHVKKQAIQHEICVYGGMLFVFMCMVFKDLNNNDVVKSVMGRESIYSKNDNNKKET